ncbi:MAG: ABC transporter substrate-binding protein [Firmicutes bacterium]|nr:ABC transporter substrate-binding protein [Bacillota bacterium]
MKKLLAVLLVFVMIFSMAACGGGGEADGEGTIKIGWVGSITGDQAVFGTCESNTIKMLIDQKNAEGGLLGRQLEFVGYDVKGDVNETINATKRLVSQDKVAGIIGPNASNLAIAMAGVLTETKTVGIATVATNTKVTINDDGELNPYSYRVCFIDPYQGSVAASWALDELGCKTAAILYDISSDYAQGFRQYFIEYFEANGGTIVADESHNSGDTDFRAQLTNIKQADPDCILIPGFYKEVALMAEQARGLGIDATLIGGDGWQSETLNEMGGKNIEGSYVVNHLDDNDPAVQPLKELYKATYGEDATVELNAYMGHDAFELLCAAIEKAGTDDPEAVGAAMTEVVVEGLTGTIKMSPEDHNPDGKEAAIQMYEYDEATGKAAPVFVKKFSPVN